MRDYEELLEAINAGVQDLVLPGEPALDPRADGTSVLFVTGVPRSGTTLAYQLLCESGALGYPSNLIARFYRNPAFGAGIQELLLPLLERRPPSWQSEYGRTRAWHEPHEFGYFWHLHFPFEDSHEPEPEALAAMDWASVERGIEGLAAPLGRPLAFKNNILGFVNAEIGAMVPRAVFLEVRRDPSAVARSILRAREVESGGADRWWSTRPRRWRELEARPAAEQVVEQIASIEEAHRRARGEVGEARWLGVTYRALCTDPRGVVASVLARFGLGEPTDLERLPRSFEPSRGPEVPGDAVEGLDDLLAARGLDGGSR